MPINKCVLSKEADLDLEDIFDYTQEEFGLNQAVEYLTEIEDLFHSLIKTPELGRTRDEIKKGLYSFPVGGHVVFYRILLNHIRIVRVLHGNKDLPRHF